MKQISNVLNVVLLIAVAVLYFLHFSSGKSPAEESGERAGNGIQGIEDIAIAYINSDSLLNNYEFFKEEAEKLEEKRAELEANYKSRAEGLQREMANFQNQAGNMTMNQAKAVQEDLRKKQQNLMMYEQSLTQQLMEKEAEINDELYDKVSSFLKDYGSNKDLQLVLTYQKGSGVLYANDSLNITNEVIEGLNEAYETEKSGGAKQSSSSDTTQNTND